MRGGPVPASDSRVVSCLLCSHNAFGGEDYGAKVDFGAHFKASKWHYLQFTIDTSCLLIEQSTRCMSVSIVLK